MTINKYLIFVKTFDIKIKNSLLPIKKSHCKSILQIKILVQNSNDCIISAQKLSKNTYKRCYLALKIPVQS